MNYCSQCGAMLDSREEGRGDFAAAIEVPRTTGVVAPRVSALDVVLMLAVIVLLGVVAGLFLGEIGREGWRWPWPEVRGFRQRPLPFGFAPPPNVAVVWAE